MLFRSELCFNDIVSIQKVIQVFPLPTNLQLMQIACLNKRLEICERSAINGTKIYLCVSCIARGPKIFDPCMMKGMCKMNFQTGKLLCAYCHTSEILCVNTIGRVVMIRNQRFYYAPCCGSVQLYTAAGGEFQEKLDVLTL